MFWKGKQKRVEEQLTAYREQVRLCLIEMVKTYELYSGDYDRTFLEERVEAVHRHEAKADDIRREIEVMMYSKALFPESRGDILGLLEAVDRVANVSEEAVRMLKTHCISMPQELHDEILQLAQVCQSCVDALLESMKKVFSDYTSATVAIGKIDQLESQADAIEEDLIERVFASDMKGHQKIIMRDLIEKIADISDRAQNASDRISIVIAKRSA